MVGDRRGLLVMAARSIITRDSDPRGLIARLTMPPAFYRRVNETRFRQEWKLPKIIYECLALGWDGEGDWRRFLQLMLSGTGARRYARIPQGEVILTNHTLSDTSTSFSGCTITFDTNGLLKGVVLNGDPQFPTFPGEWWSEEPVTAVGDNYAARYLSSGQLGTPSAGAAAADTWITMTASRSWSRNRQLAVEGVGTSVFQATFECGPEPSGPADDSALITLGATIT